jgi:hypothetical protein
MYWFEAVECLRKLVLTSAITLMNEDNTKQILYALAFNFVMLLVYTLLHPSSTQLAHTLRVRLL